MSFQFPRVSVGDPLRFDNLTILPLFLNAEGTTDYELGDAAISSGQVCIKEVSETGAVPEVLVENLANRRVLFLEGEHLLGAKQNRVLNTTVLVPARSKLTIPVSGVEQGRWSRESTEFRLSDTCTPSKVRYALKASVFRSLRAGSGHRSDQAGIWREVASQQTILGVQSDTQAMSDTFVQLEASVREFRSRLKYRVGAYGLAVAIGGKLIGLDLVDKSSTCERLWNRLVSGFAVDSVSFKTSHPAADDVHVERLLSRLHATKWKIRPAVGEGTELRCEVDVNTFALALTFSDSLIHLSVLTAA